MSLPPVDSPLVERYNTPQELTRNILINLCLYARVKYSTLNGWEHEVFIHPYLYHQLAPTFANDIVYSLGTQTSCIGTSYGVDINLDPELDNGDGTTHIKIVVDRASDKLVFFTGPFRLPTEDEL